MKREVFTEKIFMLALIAVLYFIFFFVFLVVTAKANEQLRMAYISDSPGSSAPYWIAKEAGILQKVWVGCGADLHQWQHTRHPKFNRGRSRFYRRRRYVGNQR